MEKMESSRFQPGDLIKVREGPRAGQFGRIAERASERQALYRVEFPNDPANVFFFEDEIEKTKGIPCPHCIEEKRWTQLSEPHLIEEGWVQECPIHGKLYTLGWYRAEEGQLIDLLTGKSLPINE